MWRCRIDNNAHSSLEKCTSIRNQRRGSTSPRLSELSFLPTTNIQRTERLASKWYNSELKDIDCVRWNIFMDSMIFSMPIQRIKHITKTSTRQRGRCHPMPWTQSMFGPNILSHRRNYRLILLLFQIRSHVYTSWLWLAWSFHCFCCYFWCFLEAEAENMRWAESSRRIRQCQHCLMYLLCQTLFVLFCFVLLMALAATSWWSWKG